ncbi:MAG: YggT family protein [Alphaproteobacteria bacterium]|nr:YggT family protein [Alphaproteobacteria bacterium]
MTALFWLVDAALGIMVFFIIAQVVISWLTAFGIINTYQPFVRSLMHFLYAITEPMNGPVRRLLPNLGGIDISPIVVLLLIQAVRIFLRTSIAPIFDVYGY